MFGAKQLLGTLVSSGLGAVSPARGGPAAGPGNVAGGGFGGVASIALLGTLAYKAYQTYQQGQGAPPAPPRGRQAPVTPAQEDAVTADRLSDSDAKTLIRAMIAAANADGRIEPEEEHRIHGALEQAGAGADELHFVASEIQSPIGVDELVRAARDPEMASHIYAASLLAINQHSAVNRSYLQYLAGRLGLNATTVAALHHAVGAPAPS